MNAQLAQTLAAKYTVVSNNTQFIHINIDRNPNKKVIDGHFWVQRADGEYVDPSPRADHTPVFHQKRLKNGELFYKREPNQEVETLACKIGEKMCNDGRPDSTEYRLYNCYNNAKLYIKRHGGIMVFGSMGIYFRKGMSFDTGSCEGNCPNKSIWWCFGNNEFKTISQYFPDKTRKLEKYYTKIKNPSDPMWLKEVRAVC